MPIGESYFKGNGRLSRSQFVLLFSIYPIGVPILLFAMLGASLGGSPFVLMVAMTAVIAAIFSFFTIAAKRLHDRNKRGWWSILFFVFPLFACGKTNLRLMDHSLDHDVSPLFWLCAALAFWGLVEIVFLPGTSGANRFGPEPEPLSFKPVRRFFHAD